MVLVVWDLLLANEWCKVVGNGGDIELVSIFDYGWEKPYAPRPRLPASDASHVARYLQMWLGQIAYAHVAVATPPSWHHNCMLSLDMYSLVGPWVYAASEDTNSDCMRRCLLLVAGPVHAMTRRVCILGSDWRPKLILTITVLITFCTRDNITG